MSHTGKAAEMYPLYVGGLLDGRISDENPCTLQSAGGVGGRWRSVASPSLSVMHSKSVEFFMIFRFRGFMH